MNKYFKLICFSFIIISCGYGDDNESDNNNGNNSISLFSTKARVVGYLPYYRFSLNNQIEYCKLTHLNLAFANPQSDGTIIFPSSGNNSLSDIINRAKSQNNDIQIYISLAGGALSSSTFSIRFKCPFNPFLINIPIVTSLFISFVPSYILAILASLQADSIGVSVE